MRTSVRCVSCSGWTSGLSRRVRRRGQLLSFVVVGPIPVRLPLNFFGGLPVGCRPRPTPKKYKTFQPYRDRPLASTLPMIRIATRSSALAKAQAGQVAALLGGGELVEVSSDGEVGDKARFVRGVEQALLDDRAEIGVHSAKDLPA